jgi:protoporphyrinogen oxidase
MENNKQQTAMKLYTEEQVRKALKTYSDLSKVVTENDVLKDLTHIELPSDEEIRNISIKYYVNKSACFYFEIGAKWMRDMYQDKMEAEIIKQCAEQSTSEASKYAEGYTEGYQRALDYMADAIKNKIEIKENANNEFKKGTANTTTTTFLCTEFVSDQLFYKGTLPHCMRCGKPQYQHPIITNTI